MNVICASYGNDSIALIQWAYDRSLPNTTVLYSDTGWSVDWWDQRVSKAEEWVRTLGFKTSRTHCEGMVSLVRRKKGWPRNGMQFCTTELKIKPTIEWLKCNDTEGEATCLVGVRREESARRRTFPEYTEESPTHGGRPLWAPLVNFSENMRDTLVHKAGFEVLPHRSMECFPCVNANRGDLRLLANDQDRVTLIEAEEASLGISAHGKPKFMFRPNKFQGACGIREICRWAKASHGKYDPQETGSCDSGFCGS